MKTKTIKQTVEFEGVTPQQVYDALMTSKDHTEATGAKAKVDGKAGGKFTAGDGYIFGSNVELEPGRKIVQKWRTTEWPEGAEDSLVEFALAKSPKGTKLTLTHSNVPAEQAPDYAQGWKDFYWKPMKEYFAKTR